MLTLSSHFGHFAVFCWWPILTLYSHCLIKININTIFQINLISDVSVWFRTLIDHFFYLKKKRKKDIFRKYCSIQENFIITDTKIVSNTSNTFQLTKSPQSLFSFSFLFKSSFLFFQVLEECIKRHKREREKEKKKINNGGIRKNTKKEKENAVKGVWGGGGDEFPQ